MVEGDVILVHYIHSNGWADGTLLASGARGWLPTNYCDAYDPEDWRNLLTALLSELSSLGLATCPQDHQQSLTSTEKANDTVDEMEFLKIVAKAVLFFGGLEDDRRQRRAPGVVAPILEENSIPPTLRSGTSTYSSRDSSLAPQTSTRVTLTETDMAPENQPSLSFSTIMIFNPFYVACQLTMLQSRIFYSIMPGDLLKKDGLAPDVKAMIALSTDISNLVAYTILQYSEVDARSAAIEQWINVAQRCLELRNYDALVAINGAVNSANIIRLRSTWAKVSPEYRQKVLEIQAIVAPANNNKYLRCRLGSHDDALPCLPFLGMYLTELDRADIADQKDGGSRGRTIVDKLLRFQKTPYPLRDAPDIQNWIASQVGRVHELTTGDKEISDVLDEKSEKLEPKTLGSMATSAMSTAAAVAAGRRTRVSKLSWINLFPCM